MSAPLHLASTRLISTLFAILLLIPTTIPADSLTPQQARGKQIFERGEGSSSAHPITARLGSEDSDVPATVAPCASCHGADGRSGTTEAGITPPDITWERLTKPYGGTPYTDRLLRRAVSLGINAQGAQLFGAMPRYQMLYADMDDLLAYLKVLGTVAERGVTDREIHLGVILPPAGAMTAAGQAVEAALAAWFQELNATGGVYARRVVLHSYQPAADADPAAGLAQFLDSQPMFALVASFLAGAEGPFTALLQERKLPLAGAFTLFPQSAQPVNPYVFYFYPGIPGEAAALLQFASRQFQTASVAVVSSNDKLFSGAAPAAAPHFEVNGPADFPHTADQLHGANPRAVLVLLPGSSSADWIRDCAKRNSSYSLLIPGSLVNASVLEAVAALREPSYFALPSVPADAASEGVEEYRALAARHNLPTHDVPAQWQAIASAKVLVEGLKGAGRGVTAARLVAALEQLDGFSPGLSAAVSFGPNRRVGVSAVKISRYDPATRQITVIHGN